MCLPFSIANIVTFPLSGLLCESGIDGGWPMVFYVPGAAGLLWTAVFLGLAYPSPQVHPRIGSAEKKMLTATALKASLVNIARFKRLQQPLFQQLLRL